MKEQNSSVARKAKVVNTAYLEIIELLEAGSRKIVKDLNHSRQA